jgi:beta-glucosidase
MSQVRFPKDFLWGAATASYQIEGAWNEDGRTESIWDRFSRTPGKVLNGDTGDVACDHYHLWRGDIGLMRELGLQSYRFSISWSRIIPDKSGKVNQAGVDFYDRLVDGLLEAGIKPFATLYHWDLPTWVQDNGGWESRDSVAYFEQYTDAITRRLGDRVKNWITHNEPWCASILSNWIGVHAPGRHDIGLALQVAHHLLLSHGKAIPIIRANSAGAEAGITLNFEPAYALTDSPEDVAAAKRYDGYFNRWFADPVYGRGYPEDMLQVYEGYLPKIEDGDLEQIGVETDFLGINFYTRTVVRDEPKNLPLRTASVKPADGEYTFMEWEVYPDSLRALLERLYTDYQPKKLYITENGSAYDDQVVDGYVQDADRTSYLLRHLEACKQAIDAGVPLEGYFAWSLLDNYEWAWGYDRRFGIVHVDYETQKRTPKLSAKTFSKVIEDNGFEL